MKRNSINIAFDRFASHVTKATGKSVTFITAVFIVIVWAVTGPLFHFSDTWQLVINTGTTIITFLMVFIIQQTQNKDTMAMQLKMNELIAANRNASNRLISVEDLTSDELETLKKFYISLSELAEREMDIRRTHSIEEAAKLHQMKKMNPARRHNPNTPRRKRPDEKKPKNI